MQVDSFEHGGDRLALRFAPDGDHRLSRACDLDRLEGVLDAMIACAAVGRWHR